MWPARSASSQPRTTRTSAGDAVWVARIGTRSGSSRALRISSSVGGRCFGTLCSGEAGRAVVVAAVRSLPPQPANTSSRATAARLTRPAPPRCCRAGRGSARDRTPCSPSPLRSRASGRSRAARRARAYPPTPMSWEPELEELRRREALARQMGGEESVARQRGRGKLTVRERIEMLLDEGSWRETGALAGRGSYGDDGTLTDFSPTNF